MGWAGLGEEDMLPPFALVGVAAVKGDGVLGVVNRALAEAPAAGLGEGAPLALTLAEEAGVALPPP